MTDGRRRSRTDRQVRLQASTWVAGLALAGCASAPTVPLSTQHLRPPPAVPAANGEPPPLAAVAPLPPRPAAQPAAKVERYSVVVDRKSVV
jgi:hypothetical protein